MTDEVNNSAQALAARANQVDFEGASTFGKEAWDAAVKSVARKMASGEYSGIELQQTLSRPNAASQIFYDGMADAPHEEFREWRDRQPHRAERIRKARG